MNKLFLFIYNYIKKDMIAIKEILTGDPKAKKFFSEIIKWDREVWKEARLFLLILALAFFCGFFVASQVYQYKCNTHIIRTFYPEYIDDDGNIDLGLNYKINDSFKPFDNAIHDDSPKVVYKIT